MKNFILSLSSKQNFVLAFLLFLMTVPFPYPGFSQSIDTICGTTFPESWRAALVEESQSILEYAADRNASRIVPVRFNDVAANSVFLSLTQNDVNIGLANLNQAFASAGITFVQCGPINKILSGPIANSGQNDLFIPPFSYSSNTLEVYANPGNYTSFGQLPCPIAYQSGNPNYAATCPKYDNVLFLNSGTLLSHKVFIHETGHHLGLLHTFMPTLTYSNPPTTSQFDHPYPVEIAPGIINTLWWGRELVIRQNTPGKPFPEFNSGKSGDFVKDTHADCTKTGIFFPGCPTSAQNITTCAIDPTILTYKDYNNDPVYPTPDGSDFGRNYMSYWHYECLNHFTSGQMQRTIYYFDNYRLPNYVLNCGNFEGDVEYCGSSTKIPMVTIRARDITAAYRCNVTTDGVGHFNGLLYSQNIKADVYHNGRKEQFEYNNQDDRFHLGHKQCEWVEGIDTWDLILLSRHVLGLEPLNDGYKLIAADANKTNTITDVDIYDLRKLLLGTYTKLPIHDQPWRFVPEFIPSIYANGFNLNPFAMAVNGVSGLVNSTLYTESANLSALGVTPNPFEIPDVQGLKGFDAIKIGDINGDWINDNCQWGLINPSEVALLIGSSDGSLAANDEVLLSVKTKNFNHVQGFQLGFQLPNDYFEVLEIFSTELSDYNKSDNFGLEENMLKTLWFDPVAGTKSLTDNKTLFSIKVRMKQSVSSLNNLLKLDNSILKNRFWQENPSVNASLVLEIEPVVDGRDPQQLEVPFLTSSILEGKPNPTNGRFSLFFNNASYETTGKVRITNVFGQIIDEKVVTLLPESNEIQIDAFNEAVTGTYYIEINTSDKRYSLKVIRN